jgi:hypothetical protein
MHDSGIIFESAKITSALAASKNVSRHYSIPLTSEFLPELQNVWSPQIKIR